MTVYCVKPAQVQAYPTFFLALTCCFSIKFHKKTSPDARENAGPPPLRKRPPNIRNERQYYKVLHLWELQFGNENEEKQIETTRKTRERKGTLCSPIPLKTSTRRACMNISTDASSRIFCRRSSERGRSSPPSGPLPRTWA